MENIKDRIKEKLKKSGSCFKFIMYYFRRRDFFCFLFCRIGNGRRRLIGRFEDGLGS